MTGAASKVVTRGLRGHQIGDSIPAMTLSEYLAQSEIPDALFAERIGVSRQSLHRYKQGDRRPEWSVLQRIAEETSGAVTANDFMSASPSAAAEASASLPV